jgi:hypothetical protein
VPQADGDAEVVLHPLPEDEPVRLVDPVRQRLRGIEPAERDPSGDVGEEFVAHGAVLRLPSR